MNTNTFIPSVNFHLWEPCNMRCKFCFATFQDVKNTILPKGHLPQAEAIEVVRQLAKVGFEKITFAGGEPTLCPWLSDLIEVAKLEGMTTMIVTNGTRLTDDFLHKNCHHLDWIAISIDSLNAATNLATGRAIVGKKVLDESDYQRLIEKAHHYDFGLKINTVITRLNYQEDMTDFILSSGAKRWKVLQVLPISGQNDACIQDFQITCEQFNSFINRHKTVDFIVPESNTAMKGSYVMVDPAGRFFENSKGKHRYSQPILKVGVFEALQSLEYDFQKFINRGGIYEWKK